jgi:hypothetical protein
MTGWKYYSFHKSSVDTVVTDAYNINFSCNRYPPVIKNNTYHVTHRYGKQSWFPNPNDYWVFQSTLKHIKLEMYPALGNQKPIDSNLWISSLSSLSLSINRLRVRIGNDSCSDVYTISHQPGDGSPPSEQSGRNLGW